MSVTIGVDSKPFKGKVVWSTKMTTRRAKGAKRINTMFMLANTKRTFLDLGQQRISNFGGVIQRFKHPLLHSIHVAHSERLDDVSTSRKRREITDGHISPRLTKV
jgi:hypothetical protein